MSDTSLLQAMLAAKAVSGGGGGGFTPTTEQLAAMNSGITAEKLQTDENNISTLETALNPTNYNNITVYSGRDITIAFGGYVKIGKIVIISVRCIINTAITGNNAIFSGVPIPLGSNILSAGAMCVSLANSKKINMGVTNDGNIVTVDNIDTGNLTFTGVYLAQNA